MQERQEARVQFLGREDPLEKEIVTHSSILAWNIPWTEEPGGIQFKDSQRVGCNWHMPCQSCNTKLYISVFLNIQTYTHYYKLYFFFHVVYASADIWSQVTSLISSNSVSVKSLTWPRIRFYLKQIRQCCLLSIICNLYFSFLIALTWTYGEKIIALTLRVFLILSYLFEVDIIKNILRDFNIYLLITKAMAPHSSTLAWKIPWTEKPGGLQSMGSLRVRHDWATSLPLFTFMHWRRKRHPTPVFLPGESQGRGACWAAVCGVAQSRTRLKQLSSGGSSSPGCASGKEPACQSNRHERRRFRPQMGKIPWRREWKSTPVVLPGESHGPRSLAGCRVRHNWSDLAHSTHN